jgi:hypothetical protein
MLKLNVLAYVYITIVVFWVNEAKGQSGQIYRSCSGIKGGGVECGAIQLEGGM